MTKKFTKPIKYLDYNGNPIQIGDIVIIKDVMTCNKIKCPSCTHKAKALIGSLGIVYQFGCICVEVNSWYTDDSDSIILTQFEDHQVEIIGNTRL